MRFCFEKKDFVECQIKENKLAVIGSDRELTWIQFSVEVENVCDTFRKADLTLVESPVIIYGHKSVNMLVAMYAMMKLEIPYIPVDQIYPKERIQNIINSSDSQLIINTTDSKWAIENTTECCFIENELTIPVTNGIRLIDRKPADPLVYLIYTSGSTGLPKGVQISSEAVQSFTRWMSSDFGFNSDDVFVNTAVLSFDLSVFEVMTFGAMGATLLLNTKAVTSDPESLISRIEKYNGTIWVSTPSYAIIYSRIKNENRLDCLKAFLFCGEVLPHDLATKLKTNYPQAKIFNTYGPTEATVATTLVEITPDILEKYNPLPVGKCKRESKLEFENSEIIIVGPNVSKGYVKNPELNEEKFFQLDGERAFRTGDHGMLKDDFLFFTGREDELVKLHGYRIELNEISSVMNDLNYVVHSEVIALKRNGAVKKIVSLVKLVENIEVEIEQLKSDLEKKLPAYMIPSDFKFISEIPLNQNGKADKKLLQEVYLKR